MPILSAIIPAYNGASRYLNQAIESVLSQTFTDVELIVVDDASQDETSNCVKAYETLRYHCREQNGGQAKARNNGAQLAQGQYVAFLDQDDVWEPSFLEETVNILSQDPETALVHCDGYQVSQQNHILEYDAAMKHTFSICQILRDGHDTATSGSVIRKSCFDSVGGYDEALTIWEDIDLSIRLNQQFRIRHLAKPLYRHRLYHRNVSRDISSERALSARETFLRKHEAHCETNPRAAKALQQDWAQYYSDLGKWHLRCGEKLKARSALWQSLHHNRWSRHTMLRLIRSYLPG